MNRRIFYFTRTGTSREIAEKMAASLGLSAQIINDHTDWSGPAGYLRAGHATIAGKTVSVDLPEGFADADEYIIVCPLWCGMIPPAVSAAFLQIPKNKTHLIVSSGGSLLKNRDGYLSVTDLVRRDGEGINKAKIDAFLNGL